MDYDSMSDFDPIDISDVKEEPTEPQETLPASDWNPMDAIESVAQYGAENVVAKDSASAADSRALANRYGLSRSEADDSLELQRKRAERDDNQAILNNARVTSNYLAENPADAPIFRQDIKAIADSEALLASFNQEREDYATRDLDTDQLPVEQLEYYANAEGDVKRMTTIGRGLEAGRLMSEQGVMYSKLRDSGYKPDYDFLQYSKWADLRTKELESEGTGALYQAAQVASTMYETTKAGAEFQALGAGGVAGLVLGAPVILGSLLAAGAYGTYMLEGGLSYKELFENDVNEDWARNISRGVGITNAVIEMVGLKLLGKIASPYIRLLSRQFASKTAQALTAPTMGGAMYGFVKAYLGGIGEETITEMAQEAVSMFGEELGRQHGGKNKQLTPEQVFDRLLEIAKLTMQGTAVLGLIGAPVAVSQAVKAKSDAESQKAKFENLAKNMQNVQANQKAPDAVAEVVQAQADANNVPTVFIRKYGMLESMEQKGVTIDDMRKVAPDVVKALDSTKNLSEDIRIPMGFYASRIAPTPLGEALAKHARTSETQKSADEQTMAANAAVQMHAETVKGNAQMAADVINAAVEADAVDNPESKEAKRAASHRKVIENTKKNGRFFEFDSEDKGHVTGQITINPESGRGQFIFKTQDSKWNYDATQEQIDGLGLEGLLGKLFGEGDISNFREKTFSEAYPKEAMRMEGEKLRGRIEKELRDATDNKFNTMAYKTQALWGERVARNAAVRFGMKPEDLASYAASIISTKNMPDFESLNTLAERVVRREGQVEDYSEFKDWEPEKTKSGKYLGTPQSVTTPKDLETLRARLMQLLREGLSGRYWYENSARFVMKLVNNNIKEADKFCKLLAIYSPKNGIWANALEAVRAYTYWKTGGKEEDWKPEKEGGKFSVRMEADDNKAKLVLYHDGDWDGRKTNSFYGNIMYEIVKNNMEECRRLGIPVDEILSGKSTTDLWVLRAFGYDNHSTRDDLGAGLYTFTENETRRIVANLNENLKEGEAPWTAHQVQAAIWSAIKTRSEIKAVKDTTNALSEAAGNVPKDKFGKYQYEKMKPDQKRAHDKIWFDEAMKVDTKEAERITEETQRSFADELERQTNFVTALAVPSVDVGHPINKATPFTKRLFTEDANRIIVDENGVNALAELLGIALSGVSPQFGVVEGDITPNMISMLTPATRKQESFPKELVSLYAKCLQYIFKQKSVPFFRIENKTMRKSDAPDTMYRVTNQNGHTIKSFERLADAQKFIKEKADKGYILKGSPLVRGVVIKVKQPLNDAIRAAILNEEKRLFGQDIGYTQISENEVIFINFDGENGPTRDHQDFVSSFNEFNIPELEGKSKIWAESINGPVHDWANDPKGEELLKQIRSDYEEYTRSRGITGRPQKVVSYLDSGKSKFEGILDRYGPERIAFIDNIGSLGLSEEDARNRIERQGEVKQNGSYFQKFINALPKYVQNALYQIGWHGSPFRFDAFSLAHIGEGEGHQAHGWGVYVALARDIAERYVKRFAYDRGNFHWTYNDIKLNNNPTWSTAELKKTDEFLFQAIASELMYEDKEDGYRELNSREPERISYAAEKVYDQLDRDEEFLTSPDTANIDPAVFAWAKARLKDIIEHPEQIKAEIHFDRDTETLYMVEIPENDVMLDEQAKLCNQPLKVRDALIKLLKPYFDAGKLSDLDNGRAKDVLDFVNIGVVTGKALYNKLEDILGSQKAASLALKDAGIMGIKYVGGMDGPCAVIFDDKAVTILEYFQKNPHELERAKAAMELRGAYTPDINRIWMTNKADLSTFAHETSHWYLENLLALADSDSASETVKEDVKAILKSFGLKDVLDWRMLSFQEKKKFHEQFAYHSEIYLEEGKAPTKNLEGLFRRFAAFIRDVYKQFKGGAREALGQLFKAEFGEELPELSDEVRRVLDRMIASEEEMQRAEAAEGVAPMFHVKPADMSEQEWVQMQQAWDESGSAAAEKYQQALAKDERWYTKARSALLKEKQKEGKEVRAKIREKVEREVNGRPEVKAFDILYSGGKDFGLDNLKLDPEALRASGLVNELQLAKLRAKGLCRVGGLSPSMTREMMTPFVRFTTDKQMIDALLAATDKEQIIEDETTKRCLEQHSDLFDAKKLDAIITKALHSKQRARAIALELKYLSIDKRLHTRVWLDAAHQAAMKLLATTTIKEATVRKFLASESVMARKAQQAFEAGNRELAFSYKRQQLVHHEAARIAIDAEKGMRALSDLKSRIFKSDKMLAHNYDVNLVAVVRAILTNWGFGRGDNIDGYKYLDKVEKYDEATAQVMRGVLDKYQPKPEEYGGTNLTVADFVSMMTDVKNLMNFAKQSKEFKTDEIRKDLADVVTQLHNRAVKVSPDKFRIGQHEAVSEKEARRKLVMTGKAMLRRVESWCLAMDGGETDGVFSRYIFQPIANAAARYRVRNIDLQKKLLDIVKPMAEKWDKQGAVDAKEIGYTFNRKAELIGALLHTGNRSNYEKLLLGGRGEDAMWASVFVDQAGNEIFDDSKWQAFINRCYAEGIITKEDMDTVQAIWDLLESTKEDLQKAFFDYYGYYFEEVQASEVVTPFGTYRGGYVPAMMDADLVAGRGKQVEQDLFTNESTFLDAIPMNRPGFTHSRTNVHKPLDLNIGMLGSHLQKVVRFAEMAQAVKSVNRVINNELFRSTMNNIDPTIISEMLEPWLRRSALQSVTDPMNGFGKFANRMRTLASMSLMVGNVVNGLQQYTGLSIALTKVKASSLASALFSCTMSPSKHVEYVMNLSPMMKARIKDYAFEYQNQLESISSTKMPTKADEIRDWCQRHGYFIQTFIQKQVDIPVWIAAYNDFIAEGKSEEDAVAHADSVVRTTQTSFDAEAVAKVETGSALWRMILPFYNYFNMQYNLLGERWAMRKQAGQTGKFFIDYVLVLAVPAIIAELIAQAFGGFDDDDDEYDAIDAVRLLTSSQIRNLIAMIPFAGNVINQAGASAARSGVDGVSEVAKLMFGANPYNSKVMDVPVATFTANVTQAPASLMRFLFAEGTAKKATRDMLDLLTAVSGVPFSAVKKPLGFMAAVANDEANPEDAVDVVRGLVSGKDVNK